MHCGLICGIWDWQSTIVEDLNDSQPPKHTLFCRENAFVAIYALFSDNKCPFREGVRRKGTMSPFLPFFFIVGLPKDRTRSGTKWSLKWSIYDETKVDQNNRKIIMNFGLGFGTK